jgi:ABC-2 type transport system ATP-binding protein
LDSLLVARNIRVEFGSLIAVNDVSFELHKGELLGLVGPNGAGKTTLLRVLAGLHVPHHGEATILSRPVLGKYEVVRHHVGFAPDSPPAYEDLTIYQFLRFIAGIYQMSVNEANERIDFWLEHLWLEEKRETKVKELSRGMRQRVTLARTFLPRPHVILLDEPLSGLDPAGRVELRRVLSMLRDQGCAMVVSSHILADLEEVSTHIGIIEAGTLRRFCTTDSLRDHQHERRIYEVSVTEDAPTCVAWLTSQDGVDDVAINDGLITFGYDADNVAAAALLRSMVQSGVKVASFGQRVQTLEQVYLNAGLKQVD